MLTRNSAVCLDTDLERTCPFYPIISGRSTQPLQLLCAHFYVSDLASAPRTEGKDKIWRRSHKVAMARFPAKDDGLVFVSERTSWRFRRYDFLCGWWSWTQLIGWRLLVSAFLLGFFLWRGGCFEDVWWCEKPSWTREEKVVRPMHTLTTKTEGIRWISATQ